MKQNSFVGLPIGAAARVSATSRGRPAKEFTQSPNAPRSLVEFVIQENISRHLQHRKPTAARIRAAKVCVLTEVSKPSRGSGGQRVVRSRTLAFH